MAKNKKEDKSANEEELENSLDLENEYLPLEE